MDASEQNPESRLLLSEIQRLEAEEHRSGDRLEALRSELEKKSETRDALLKEIGELKKQVSGFIAEEDGLIHQKNFLEAEREKHGVRLTRVSESYDENMEILEDLMRDVGFMRGEIETLEAKTEMLETEIPYRFNDSENLDKRVKVSFFRALNSLEKRINDVQQKAEVIYYKKGETG